MTVKDVIDALSTLDPNAKLTLKYPLGPTEKPRAQYREVSFAIVEDSATKTVVIEANSISS